MTNTLSRLLKPRSIAVIGGGTWCENIITQCLKIGFDGPVWPVHPNKTEIAGQPCVPSVEALPAPPDACFIGVNRHATIEVVRALSGMNAGGAVCFASGFEESQSETQDGAQLQADLLAAAGDMPILGPNCYGLINAMDRTALWPDEHGCVPAERGVALLTQSSNIAINLTMQVRGLPVGFVGTLGNQAQVDLARLGLALLDDPRITALGLYIEGIKDIPAFEDLARKAIETGKRIVALKTGASETAQAAAVSHTASLAGSDAGAQALFDRLGIARVGSLAALLETLKILHFHGPLASSHIASLSCSGGEASLIADAALPHELTFPPLVEGQKARLGAALGPKVALANPLDYHTYIWGDLDAMEATYAAVASPGVALTAIVVDFPRADLCDPTAWEDVITAASRARAQHDAPVALLASLPECMSEAVAVRIAEAGLIPLCGLDESLAAIAAAASLGEDIAAPLLPAGPLEATRLWSEADGKAALAACGIDTPTSARAADADEAAALAWDIEGTLVLKGEGAAHKSEAGLVALGLDSTEAVREAASAMQATGFLVEEQITGPATEMLVGVLRDPAHGFVLTMGAGGTLTELLGDTVSLLVPATREAVAQALARLKINRHLQGWRGAPAGDREALLDAVMAVQDFVTHNAATLVELEINPLLVTPTRAVAVDALIRTGEPT